MAGTIITKKGMILIAKLLASNQELVFTRAAVGTGSAPHGWDPAGMIGLNQYKMDGKISSCHSENEEATVVFQISSTDVESGFVITEAGIFAEDPDEGEILYAYLDLSDDPQYVYAKNSVVQKFAEIEFKTVVGAIENITVITSPDALVTKEVFEKEIDALNNPEFEDYSAEGAEAPDARTAIEEIKSKKSIFGIMSNIKAALKGLVTLGEMKELLVNNGLCNIPGQYFLDAAFGKNLQDQVTDVNNNFSGSGFPNAVLVEDLHEIRKTCVFYYDTGAANSPLTDRGGMGICMYRHDNWIDLMVIPYAQTITYISEKRSTWSSWTQDYINQGNIEPYVDAQSCMDGLFNWVINIPINSLCFKIINAQFTQNASISGELFGGVFQILAYRNGNFANITALSYWDNRPIIFGTIQEGKWKSRFIKCPVSPGLGVEQNVLYQSGRGVYFEVGQQNDFTRFVINNRWVAIEHFTNGTKDKTISLWDGS